MMSAIFFQVFNKRMYLNKDKELVDLASYLEKRNFRLDGVDKKKIVMCPVDLDPFLFFFGRILM